jgi:serine-type D-Ala-D-Ala carboxypeptidase/endopeptidase
MTSGLPNEMSELSNLPRKDRDVYTKRDFLRDLHAVKIVERPGNNPGHSNAAAELLGFAIENVYGASFEDLVVRFIEKPLEMQSGAASANRPRAKGYNDQNAEAAPSGSAAGLRYSTADMVKYVAHELDEQDQDVALSHRSTWETLDKQQSIGFFWIASKADGGRRLRYSGGTRGFSSFCDLYPEQKVGVVLLANNSDAGAQDRLKAASERIIEAIRKSAVRR